MNTTVKPFGKIRTFIIFATDNTIIKNEFRSNFNKKTGRRTDESSETLLLCSRVVSDLPFINSKTFTK